MRERVCMSWELSTVCKANVSWIAPTYSHQIENHGDRYVEARTSI